MSFRTLATRTLRAGQTRALLRRGMNDGDRQLGDYPTLPFVSRQFNDPHAHWDKQDRRKHNESVRLCRAAGLRLAPTAPP